MHTKIAIIKQKLILKYLRVLTFFTFFLSLYPVAAQNVIPATGNEAEGSDGSVSYTVGQMVYTSNSGDSGSVSQGVQQPYEISIVSSIEEVEGISLLISAYPNPARDILKLNIENRNIQDLFFELYDIQGSLIETKQILSSVTTIEIMNLPQAQYFLKVKTSTQYIKIFKIIKN